MYNISENARKKMYSGSSLYKCVLTIGDKLIEPRYLKSIKISDPIIDTSNKNMYIGTFISKQVEISFQNAMDIDVTQKVYLKIGIEGEGISNIFDPATTPYINQVLINSENSIINIISAMTYKLFYIECEPNTKYTITSSDVSLFSNSTLKLAYSLEIPSVATSVNQVEVVNSNNYEYTTGEDAQYLILSFNQTTDEIISKTEVGTNGTTIEYVPIGYFNIETSPEDYYKNAKITALDNAVLFKPNVDISEYFIRVNLFDKDNPNLYTYTNNETSKTNNYCYIECEANKSYTISKLSTTKGFAGYTSELPSNNEDFVLEEKVDFDNTNVKDEYDVATVTTDNSAKYLVVMFQETPNDDVNSYEDVLNNIEIHETGIGSQDYITAENLLKSLCEHFGVELGTYPNVNRDVIIGSYDNTISGKQYVSWLAEIMGSNAKIGRDGKLYLVPVKNLSTVTIDVKSSKSWTKGELYKISRVVYDNGVVKHEFGETTDNTLTIRQDNLFVSGTDEVRDKIVENIYNAVNGLEIWNVTNENYGDISLDSTDIVTYTIGEEQYPTYYDCTLTYQITIMAKVSVSIPTKQVEETTNKIEADIPAQIRSIKTTIDQQNAELTIVATKTETIDTKVENNYQEIVKKFDGYTPVSDTVTIQNQVTQIINSTYTRTEIDTKMVDGTVEAVNTKTGMTFDKDGLTIDKTGSQTKGNFNEKGLTVYKINQETGELTEAVLEAVYDDTIGETKVNATNFTAYKFFMLDNVSRFQNFTDINGQIKTGAFWINYDESESEQ